MKPATKNLILAAMLGALGLTAGAQTPPPMPAGPGGAPGHMMPRDGERWGHEQMQRHMQERMAQRMGVFKQALQITPAQEGAWNAWASAMRPVPHQRPDPAEMLRMTTPERIDRMRAMRAARNADMDRRAEATKAFYASLSTEQKRVFDTASMKFMSHGGERGGHGGRMRHGM